MAYPVHWKLAIGGTFTDSADGSEIWEFGIRGLPPAGSTHSLDDAAGALADIQGAIATWFADPVSRMRSDAQLVYAKLNKIGPDGRYANPTTVEHFYTSTIIGATGGNMPPFITLAWSFGTARARGIGSHGRIFPPYALPITSSNRLSPTAQTAALTSFQNLCQAIENPGHGATYGIAPCVVSKGNKAGTQPGLAEPVTTLRVGDVVDVQRRRKSAARDNYASHAGPPWA